MPVSPAPAAPASATKSPEPPNDPTKKDDPPPAPPAAPAAPAAPASPFADLSPEQKDRLLSIYSGTIKGYEERLSQMDEKIAGMGKKADAPTADDLAAANKGFFEKPIETTTEIVRREIRDAVAPLTDFVKNFSNKDEYTTIKDDLKRDPKLKEVFDKAEGYIDQLVQKNVDKGNKVSRDIVVGAVAGIKGSLELGLLPGISPNPPAPAAPPASGGAPVIPPSVRPSAPPAPGPTSGGERRRELTESERRVARENNMSDEEYLHALDIPSRDVVKKEAWEIPNKDKK